MRRAETSNSLGHLARRLITPQLMGRSVRQHSMIRSDSSSRNQVYTHRTKWTVLFVFAVSAGGSDGFAVLDPTTLPVPIAQFARSQGIDKLRGYTEILNRSTDDALFFRLSWGEPMDCPSGCFFASGDGLLSGGRIGWISYEAVGYLFPRIAQVFDFFRTDAQLFDTNLLPLVRDADELTYSNYRLVLSCDGDVPEPMLLVIAESLAIDGWPFLGRALLEHATVLRSVPILEILVGIQGNAYSDIRERATAALEAIWAGRETPGSEHERACSIYSIVPSQSMGLPNVRLH